MPPATLPQMSPERSVWVCGTPRAGTSLIATLLAATGAVGWPGEWFWRDEIERAWREWEVRDWAAYVDELRRRATAPNGVFGCKLMWALMADCQFELRRLSREYDADDVAVLRRFFGEPSFVWIRREDEIAQAVSFARAVQTGQWIAAHEPTAAPAYDPEQIGALLELIRVHSGAWRRWFAAHGIRPVEVVYERLCDDHGIVLGILNELELEPVPGSDITPPTWLQRQADDVSAEWIERFAAERG